MARNLKITLQYDGTNYAGWQRQANGESIQGLLEDALAPIEGRPVTVHGAGRTDAGVHALAQVATVSLEAAIEPRAVGRALNAVLPHDVRIIAVEEAAPQFHARFSAVGKLYEYRIVNAPLASPFLLRYAWHVPQPLDFALMRDASRFLVGRHDFTSFQGRRSASRSAQRTVAAIDWQEGDGRDSPAVMRIEGDGFLRHMVRNIVGTIVQVGTRRWPPAQMAEILEARDRVSAGPTAPAHGLFLVRVNY